MVEENEEIHEVVEAKVGVMDDDMRKETTEKTFDKEKQEIFSYSSLFFLQKTIPLSGPFLEYVALYLFWMSSHYILSQVYVYYCTPSGTWGFLKSMFTVGAPHCHIVRNMFTFTGDVVQNMWVVFGIWSCKHILNFARKNM